MADEMQLMAQLSRKYKETWYWNSSNKYASLPKREHLINAVASCVLWLMQVGSQHNITLLHHLQARIH